MLKVGGGHKKLFSLLGKKKGLPLSFMHICATRSVAENVGPKLLVLLSYFRALLHIFMNTDVLEASRFVQVFYLETHIVRDHIAKGTPGNIKFRNQSSDPFPRGGLE